MRTNILILLVAVGFFLPIRAHADTDCAELAVAMKNKTAWWKENDFSSALEEWIKKTDFSEFKNKSKSSLNIGVVVEGVPIQLGADTSEDDYRRVKNDLAAGRKLTIVSHTREQFIEESLSGDAIEVLANCILGQDAGFHAALIRRKNQEYVTLALVYRPIEGTSGGGPCKIKEIELVDLEYANDETKQKVQKGLLLEDRVKTFINLRRTKGSGDVVFKTGMITVAPSLDHPVIKDIDAIKLPPPLQYPNEKIARLQKLLTKFSSERSKKEQAATAIESIDLCNEIFELLRTIYPKQMQKVITVSEIEKPAAISNQMDEVVKRMRVCLSHYDVSSEARANECMRDWGQRAIGIMNELRAEH